MVPTRISLRPLIVLLVAAWSAASVAATAPTASNAETEQTGRAASARSNDAEEGFSWRLEGLEGELEANVRAQLSAIPDNISTRSRYRTRVRQAVREGLRALGYYSPTIEFRWESAPTKRATDTKDAKEDEPENAALEASESAADAKDDAAAAKNPPAARPKEPQKPGVFEQTPVGQAVGTIEKLARRPNPSRVLRVKVTPGEPVRIAAADVKISGDAAQDPAFKRLLAKVPEKGTVLNHGEYDAFKNDLVNTGVARGYFDARFERSMLGIAPDRNEAYWMFDYRSGERYRVGKVRFTGSQIRESYLQNLVPWVEGEEYAAEDVAELNRRLSASGWFNSVMVAPVFEETAEVPASDFDAIEPKAGRPKPVRSEDPDETVKVVPVSGVVTPKQGNSMEVGLGYSTDVGPRAKATWVKPWVNDRGHSLQASTAISAYEQELEATYRIPEERAPLEEYWLLQSGLKHTDLNDTKSQSMTFKASRFWEMSMGWQRAANLQWSIDKFTQGADDNTTMLIYPGVSLSRTRTRGGLMPVWGDTQRYTLDVSNTIWGSDIDFIVFNAQGALVRTYDWKHRFVLRGNFGWIETGDFDEVPPDLRFFAGGDRSVRGYDYKSISPKDETGELIGAQRLLTASVEYQYKVTGKWWGAVFVDAGEAVDKFSSTNFKTGVGFGIRWESPVGPIKFDIARPVGDSEHKDFAFYIGLGPEL